MITRGRDLMAVRAEGQRRDRHGHGIGLGNGDDLGLAEQERPVLARAGAVVLRPLGDPRLQQGDLVLGQGIELVGHPRLGVGQEHVEEIALLGLAGHERDPLALLAPLGELGERRHHVLALGLLGVVAGDAVSHQDRGHVAHEADRLRLRRLVAGRPGLRGCGRPSPFGAAVWGGSPERRPRRPAPGRGRRHSRPSRGLNMHRFSRG